MDLRRSCRLIVLTSLAMPASACSDVCSFDDQVGRFFDENPDAVDCKFAHQFYSSGEGDIVGADIVRDCIMDSIAGSRSFVGGYLLGGIDSSESFAFLGESTPNGMRFSKLYEHTYQRVTIRATSCLELTARDHSDYDIGIDCVGANLMEVCSE